MVKYIEIGGEKRPVRYNQNALEEFEEMTGQDTLTGVSVKKIKHLKALTYCGLKHGFLEVCDYKKEFPHSLTDVGRWLDIENASLVFQAFRGDSEAKETDGAAEVADGKKSPAAT